MSLKLIVVFLVIPITLALNLTQTNRTLNSAVEKDCLEFVPQSCFGVCGQFFTFWCSCDEYCLVYGRCCYDYESVCKEESEKSKQDHENLMNVTIECDSNISGSNVPQQIITSCSLTNVSVKTVELCEEETRTAVVVSKVMSKRTELHYKNRHCMLCNDEDEDDIVYWSTIIGTNNRRQRPTTGQGISKLFENAIIIIPPPKSREILCYPNMISTCISSASQEEQRLCGENALSPIKYLKSIYKNTFCLQCNIILKPNDTCSTADRKDIFYGGRQSYAFSMVLNWNQNRESIVSLDSSMTFIRSFSCSFDDNDHVTECKVRKCAGTLPVVNNTCQVVSNHFGCIQYGFIINFTIPSESSREIEQEVEGISSTLVKLVATYERLYNMTKYYSQNVTLYNITIVDDQITGLIILNRMVYYLCYSQLIDFPYGQFYEYLDSNLDFNLTGSITTHRYLINCHDWCSVSRYISFGSMENKEIYQRFFTSKQEISLGSTSSVTKLTPKSVYVVFLIGILVDNLWQ